MRFAAIINPGASTLKTVDMEWLSATLFERFADCGHEIIIRHIEGADVLDAMNSAVSDDNTDAVLAGGGDGTISAAASVLQGTGKPLAVLPGGNMNLFARTLSVPLDLDAAITALAHGEVSKADIAFANDRPFVHEFSLGLHPEMIEARDQQRYGSRIAKLIGGMRSLSGVILRPPRVRVWLDNGDGVERAIATPALAISNNPYGEGHAPYADRIDGGVLGVYIAHSMNPADLATITARVSIGSWSDMPQMEIFTAKKVRLAKRRPMKAAIDGELVRMRGPVTVRVEPGALSVIMPREEHAVRGQ
jgi:diacylglycerol kinase family enzyme